MHVPVAKKEALGSCLSNSLPGTPFSEVESCSKFSSPACESFTERGGPCAETREKREERQYFANGVWCEYRIIILLQEAARASLRRLKQRLENGEIEAATYVNQKRELIQALLSVKNEYRRTLNKFKARDALPSELTDIASKAVQSVASLFPWSSDGFLLSFVDNILFGDAMGRRCGFKEKPSAAAEKQTQPEPLAASAPQPGRPLDSRRPPPIVIKPVATNPLAATLPRTTSSEVAGKETDPESPAAAGLTLSEEVRRAPHIYGPVHPSESRYLDNRLLTCCDTAFISRSLVPVSFIGLRRSKLANHNMRQRLKAASIESECRSPCSSSRGPPVFSVQLTCNNSVSSHGISDVSEFSCCRSSPSTPISLLSHEASFKVDE